MSQSEWLPQMTEYGATIRQAIGRVLGEFKNVDALVAHQDRCNHENTLLNKAQAELVCLDCVMFWKVFKYDRSDEDRLNYAAQKNLKKICM